MTMSLRDGRRAGIVLLLFCSVCYAEDMASHPPAVPGSMADKLRKSRMEIASQIAELTSSEKKGDDVEKSNSPNSETILLLRSIDAVYAQQQSLLEQRQQLDLQSKQAEKELKRLDTFEPDEPRPYSFLLLESLKDQDDVEDDREQAIDADLKSAKKLLQAAHEELNDAESDHQKLAAKSSKEQDAAKELLHSELAIRRARAKIAVKQTEIEVQQLRADICKTKQKQLAKKIKVVKKDVTFTVQDRDRQLERLAGKEAELKRLHRDCEIRLQQVESQPFTVFKEKKAEAETENTRPSEKSKGGSDEKKGSSLSAEDVKSQRRVVADVAQAELVLLDQQIENISELRRVWKRRYELAHSAPDRKELKKWLADVEKFRSQIKDMTFSIEHRQNSVRDDQAIITEPNGEHRDVSIASGKEGWHARLQEFRDLSEKSLDDNKATDRMLNRFRGDLKTKIKETASLMGMSLGETFQSFADYEVTEVEDESITIGRIAILTVYILMGLVLAYLISRIIGVRLFRRLGWHQGTVAAWKSIVFYTMCVFFGILSFRLLHVPLGAFAFLGGAAAIAIGFGSQDIMNNFMSGIILLTEQPIRVGDVIELDDIQGEVTHIGLRSTRVLTVSNYELILANKMILDEQVTNLTLSDDFLKSFVTIELDRSIEVREAKAKMLKLAFQHPMIIKTMRPFVLIKEVDCYSVKFEVHFWVQHQGFIKNAIVQSDILESLAAHFVEPKSDSDSSSDTAEETTVEEDVSAKAAATASLAKQVGKIPEKLLRSQIHKKGPVGLSVAPDTLLTNPQTMDHSP